MTYMMQKWKTWWLPSRNQLECPMSHSSVFIHVFQFKTSFLLLQLKKYVFEFVYKTKSGTIEELVLYFIHIFSYGYHVKNVKLFFVQFRMNYIWQILLFACYLTVIWARKGDEAHSVVCLPFTSWEKFFFFLKYI